MKRYYQFIFSVLLFFIANNLFAHSVQVAYCISCSGQLTLYVEHWHGSSNPSGTTMTIQITVNGVTTTQTGSPSANLQNIPFAQLPNCASPPVVFASCPNRANTYNDWVVYTFNNIPTNATAQIKILSGNNYFTEDACGMFPALSNSFVVAPLNQPPITIPPSYVCSGTQSPGVTFPPGNPPGGNYIWTNDNTSIGIPASGSGNIPPFNPPASSTTQVANITVSYLCATTNFTITVLPSAGPNFNYVNILNASTNGDPAVQCLGDSTQFQAQATPGVTIQNVVWDFGDGTSSTALNPTHLFQNEGTYNVVLTVTTTDGCTQTSTSTITVYPKPVASYTSSPTCEHDAVAFTNTSSISSGVISAWNWDFGDGNTSTVQHPSHLYSQDGSYPIELTVTSTAGCQGSTTGTQVVYQKPVANFTVSTECKGDATVFTDVSTASVALSAWEWDFNNDGIIDNTNQNTTYIYPSNGNPSIHLKVADANGCYNDTLISTIVHPRPVASFVSNEVCPSFATTLTDNSTITGGGTITAWNWDISNDGTVEYTTQNASNVWMQGGSYSVELKVVSSDGCADSVVNNVVVDPKPVANFTSNTVCKNDATIFTDGSSVVSGTVDIFEWSFGDGNTDVVQNPSHVYANDGSYNATLIVTTNNGCKDTVTNVVNVYSLPVASFSSSVECLNVATVLTDQTITSSSISMWEWDYENDGVVDNNNQNTSHTYSTFGFFPVKLKVIDINGCVDDTIAPIEVKPLPVASFVSDEVCPNFATTLIDSSTVDGGAIITAWNWDITNDGTVEYTTQNASNVWMQGGSYSVELMVETADGCTDSVVNTITVYPKPVADFMHTTVCFGIATDFTDLSSVTLNNSVTTWDWDFNDGNTSNLQNPSNLYASYGIYDVILKIETNNGCRDTVTKQVEVYGMPIANFNVQNICEYETANFNNTTTIPSGDPMTYIWNFGDNTMLGIENPTHQYASEGNYNVNLQATSSNGCVHDTTISFDVYDEPLAQFAMTNACVYEEFNFTDYSVTTSTLSTWQWDFNDGNTNSTQSPSHYFSAEGIYSIQLVVTTIENCSDTNTIDLEVYPKPVANFTPTDVCLDFPTQFEDISTVSTQVFSNESILPYSGWSFGDGTTASGHTATHIYNSPGTYASSIIVSSNHGCRDTAYLDVVVHSNPVADFTVADSAGCSPIVVSFINNSSINNVPSNYTLSYQWYFGNDSLSNVENPTSTFVNASHTATQTYEASLVVTSNIGCKDSVYKMEVAKVFPIPLADFTFTPEETPVYNTLIEFSDASVGADSWTWDYDNGAFSNEQNPSYRYADTGLFNIQLRVENSYGCADSVVKSLTIKPVYELFIPNSITPNGDGVNDDFRVKGYGIHDVEIFVYDKWGQLIYEGYNLDSYWDGYVKGKLNKTAVYVYVIKVKDMFNEGHVYKGSVTVIY